MKAMRDTFLAHREMGECEAFYRMFPSLHLCASDIGTVFIHTGFHKSKFLRKVDPESTDGNLIELENREGKYVEGSSMSDKYERRPDKLKHMTMIQWYKRYTPMSSRFKEKDCSDEENDEDDEEMNSSLISSSNSMNSLEEDFIIALDPAKRVALPKFIHLKGPFYSGEPRVMKLRKPCAVRYHKFKKESQAHEYYFSELELYHVFSDDDEKDKCKDDFNFCLDTYVKFKEEIDYVREKTMPYLIFSEEALELAQEIVNEDKIEDELDAETAQRNADDQEEGHEESDEFIAHDPDQVDNPSENPFESKCIFKVLPMQDREELIKLTQSLDDDQLFVVDLVIDYLQQYKRARAGMKNKQEMNSSLEDILPAPLYLVVIGSAGTGKSHIIYIVSQWCEIILKTEGDNIDHPYCIRVAVTGTAASSIDGQTLHSAFKFEFGNEFTSLNDKYRDLYRILLRNLVLGGLYI